MTTFAAMGHSLRQVVAGTVGSLHLITVGLTLGLLVYSPLGAAAPPLGLVAGMGCAVVGGLAYALLGRAPMPTAGPSTATCLVVAAFMVQIVGQGHAAAAPLLVALAIMLAGLLQALIGALGLTRLASFVPQPVLAGFMNGVALQVALAQWPLLVGRSIGQPAGAVSEWQPLALLAGLATTVAVVVLSRRWPRLPATLILLVAGSVLVAILHAAWPGLPLGEHVGALAVPDTLPGLLGLVNAPWPMEAIRAASPALVTAALLVALVGSLESTLNALSIDRLRGTRQDLKHELTVLGGLNVGLGALGMLPVLTTRSRAVALIAAGGEGRFAVAASSVVLGVLVVGGSALIAWLPLPVLAGLMLTIALALADRATGQLMARWWRGERTPTVHGALAVIGCVTVTTLILGIGAGVALGVVISLVQFVARMNRSLVRDRYDAAARPSRRIRMPEVEGRLSPLRRQVVIVELEGALFFGSGERLLAIADTLPPDARALILDLRRVGTIDETGAVLLDDLTRRVAAHHAQLHLAGVRDAVGYRLDRLQPPLPRWPDLDRAIEAAEDALLLPTPAPARVAPAQCLLFEGLAEDDRTLVIDRMPARDLARGQTLFSEGEPGDALYLLLAGSISVYGSRHGRADAQRFLSISPGMMLGEVAVLDGRGRTGQAVADEGATVLVLGTDALRSLERDMPRVAARLYHNIAVHLSQRLRDASTAWRQGEG